VKIKATQGEVSLLSELQKGAIKKELTEKYDKISIPGNSQTKTSSSAYPPEKVHLAN